MSDKFLHICKGEDINWADVNGHAILIFITKNSSKSFVCLLGVLEVLTTFSSYVLIIKQNCYTRKILRGPSSILYIKVKTI